IARALGRNHLEPEIAGKARTGDIRPCFCDGSKAAEMLGFRAYKDFDEGLAELAEWVASQSADDRVDQARAELEAKGLVA
ncbi:MAG: nucleoside-diphosphate-sugar epimerase, partial [Microvirga sp.]